MTTCVADVGAGAAFTGMLVVLVIIKNASNILRYRFSVVFMFFLPKGCEMFVE
jgi:hypothetical protein